MRRDELFSAFESLGNNCEFGIVQEAAGYPALSLFGSAGFASVTQIIHAIDCSLEGMFQNHSCEFVRNDGWPDYGLRCRLFDIMFHTGLLVTDTRAPLAFSGRLRSFCRLKEKLLADLRDGSKIFVFRGNEGFNDYLAGTLAASIQQHGPGRLLWVGEDKRPERRFAWVESPGIHGLLYGGMPNLSNSAPVRISYDAWDSIARQALSFFHGEIHTLRNSRSPARTARRLDSGERLLQSVAQYKSTQQSSISEWSNLDTTEADSAGAVNGRLDQIYGFHTAEESEPWWRVDLGDDFTLEAIIVHNRADHAPIAERAFPLSILLSLDQSAWTRVHTFSAESSVGQGNHPLIWSPQAPTVARYIKLQVERRSILHLVQVEVFGATKHDGGSAPSPGAASQGPCPST
jgi:hypothetical protein